MKRKRIPALLLALLVILSLAAPVYAEGRVIHISSVEGLRSLVQKCRLDTYSKGITVVLDTDLDLKNEPFEPFAAFSGTFIGNNHTISGFVPSTDGAHQGFFRFILEDGVVRNLHVQGAVTPQTVRTQVGGLVGTNYGTVAACSFSGEVRGLEMVGGVAGENYGTLLECMAYGEVSGKRFTGGVVGSSEGTVSRCENSASVNITIETSGIDISDIDVAALSTLPLVTAKESDTVSDTGGIAGFSTGIISSCVNRGTVGYQHYGYNIGGLVGRQSGLVSDCQNYGYVCGRKDVAGIAGQMEPFVLLTTTENLISELQLMSDAINVAMNNVDANAGGTRAVMDQLSSSASSAEKNVLDINANSDKPILIVEEPESAEQKEADRQAFKGKVDNFFTASGDNLSLIMDGIGEDTMGRLMSGDIDSLTDDDWARLSNVGTDQISTGGAYGSIIDDIRARRAERDAEDAAKEEAYNEATASFRTNMSSVGSNIALLGQQLASTASTLASDMRVVNYHFSKAMNLFAKLMGGEMVSYSDLSDENEDFENGLVLSSTNYGSIDGDINVGGIGGEMGIELEYDMEGVLAEELTPENLISNDYETYCVAKNCVNDGLVIGKNENIGGVIGSTSLGSVIACEGYGDVAAEEATCVGGIVGKSDTVVRGSFALCHIDGLQFVGGIVGSGEKVRDCGSRVDIDPSIPSVGAIAGYADVWAEEELLDPQDKAAAEEAKFVRGNFFISDTLGGIEGVSYGDKAIPLSDEEFMETEGLPLRFKELTVSFAAEGQLVSEVKGIFAESLDESLVPAVPDKAGYTGYWPEVDFSDLRSDMYLEAVYYLNQTSLASELAREGSPMSLILLNGDFGDQAKLRVSEYAFTQPVVPGCITRETWQIDIDENKHEKTPYSVHYLAPEPTDKRNKIVIYVSDGTAWRRTSTRTSGSYTMFDGMGNSLAFSVIEVPSSMTPVYTMIGGAVLAVIALLVIFRKKLGFLKKRTPEEKEAAAAAKAQRKAEREQQRAQKKAEREAKRAEAEQAKTAEAEKSAPEEESAEVK